jgi:hypothetical protein
MASHADPCPAVTDMEGATMTEFSGVDGGRVDLAHGDRLELVHADLVDVALVPAENIRPLASADPDQTAPTTDNGLRPEDGPPLDQPPDGDLAGEALL